MPQMTSDRARNIHDNLLCLTFCLLTAGCLVPKLAALAAAVMGFVLFATYPLAYGARPPVARQLMMWLAALAILALASCFWAINPAAARSAMGVALVLLPCGLLTGLSMTASGNVQQRLCRIFPILYFIAAVLLAFDLYSGMALYRIVNNMPTGRVRIDWGNRAVTYCVLLYLPAAAFLAAGLPPKKRWLAVAALTAPILLIMARTAGQAAQLAFALEILFAALFPYRARFAWYVLTAMIVLAILGAPWLAMAMFRVMPPWVDQVPWLGYGKAFANNRLEIWDFVSRYALKHPLHGFGIEATRTVEAFDTQLLYQKKANVLHPHNFAIQMWIEFGLAGALLAAVMMARLLWHMMNRLTVMQQRIALPVLIACLCFASMSYGLWQGWWLALLSSVMALTCIATMLPGMESSRQAEKTAGAALLPG
jgi:O-antigen ligase